MTVLLAVRNEVVNAMEIFVKDGQKWKHLISYNVRGAEGKSEA